MQSPSKGDPSNVLADALKKWQFSMVNALGSDPRSCGRNSFLLDARIVREVPQAGREKHFHFWAVLLPL